MIMDDNQQAFNDEIHDIASRSGSWKLHAPLYVLQQSGFKKKDRKKWPIPRKKVPF